MTALLSSIGILWAALSRAFASPVAQTADTHLEPPCGSEPNPDWEAVYLAILNGPVPF